jgi:hypothetical protein
MRRLPKLAFVVPDFAVELTHLNVDFGSVAAAED